MVIAIYQFQMQNLCGLFIPLNKASFCHITVWACIQLRTIANHLGCLVSVFLSVAKNQCKCHSPTEDLNPPYHKDLQHVVLIITVLASLTSEEQEVITLRREGGLGRLTGGR